MTSLMQVEHFLPKGPYAASPLGQVHYGLASRLHLWKSPGPDVGEPACRGAKACIGESAVSAAPFFDSAGRPNQPFWGDQTGPRLILWESLDDDEKRECLKMMKTQKIGLRQQPLRGQRNSCSDQGKAAKL